MLDSEALACFPNNVVSMIADELAASLEDPIPDEEKDRIRVIKRPIRRTDYTQTISVMPAYWTPDMDSLEMAGGPNEPTIQTYRLLIEAYVVDSDEERGLATHSLLSTRVRTMLYRSQALRVSLPMLQVDLDGYREKFSRWGIAQQVFQNDEINNGFTFLSTVEYWFETDTEKM